MANIWIISVCLLINLGALSCLPSDFVQTSEAAAPGQIRSSSSGIDTGLLTDNTEDRGDLPPFVFPDDPRTYKFVPASNETALKILQHNTEVFAKIKDAKDFLNTAENDDAESDLKNDFEEVQPLDYSKSPVELEEQFHHPSSNLQVNEVFVEDIETSGPKLKDGHIAAIFAGILAVLCIGIYVGLVVWRHYLEKRYGMRERLVTHDDYYNNNDFRHFEDRVKFQFKEFFLQVIMDFRHGCHNRHSCGRQRRRHHRTPPHFAEGFMIEEMKEKCAVDLMKTVNDSPTEVDTEEKFQQLFNVMLNRLEKLSESEQQQRDISEFIQALTDSNKYSSGVKDGCGEYIKKVVNILRVPFMPSKY